MEAREKKWLHACFRDVAREESLEPVCTGPSAGECADHWCAEEWQARAHPCPSLGACYRQQGIVRTGRKEGRRNAYTRLGRRMDGRFCSLKVGCYAMVAQALQTMLLGHGNTTQRYIAAYKQKCHMPKVQQQGWSSSPKLEKGVIFPQSHAHPQKGLSTGKDTYKDMWGIYHEEKVEGSRTSRSCPE